MAGAALPPTNRSTPGVTAPPEDATTTPLDPRSARASPLAGRLSTAMGPEGGANVPAAGLSVASISPTQPLAAMIIRLAARLRTRHPPRKSIRPILSLIHI